MGRETYNTSSKAEIIPIINAVLEMDAERLYSLNIEVLNEIFNILQLRVIPIERLKEIISSQSTSNAVMNAIMREPRSIPQIDTIETKPPPIRLPEASPSPIEIPETRPSPVAIPEVTPSQVSVPEDRPSPVDIPEVTPSPVSVPDARSSPLDIPTASSPNIDVPDEPDEYITPSNVTLPPQPTFSQNSIKADIIPVIQNSIKVDSEKLFSLTEDTLNQIFGLLESGTISNPEIESIINASSDSTEIQTRIREKLSTPAPSTDSFKEDLITGILFNLPEVIRPQIEAKLRAIDDINKLTELSQVDLPEVQSLLGIEAPAPRQYDEKSDIRAGILAQLPPSLRGALGDRLNEIDDMAQLLRLSQMTYVQIQQSLGMAPQSASFVPPEYANPVDTASQSSDGCETPSTPAAPAPANCEEPPQAERLQAQLRERSEKNKENILILQKMAEKIWKVKISQRETNSPEGLEVIKKLDILLRVHPPRVEQILDHLKRTKDKKRFKALFDWYVYSQRIEEIETYVEHWQGQVQGIGGFRAAINVSRFDPIVRHLPTKEIEGVNVQARKALERVHSSNLNVRARGVEDIKQISNYLLQKAR